MGKLSNKTALITGGSSGLGTAIAKLFAAEGATVAIQYHQGTAQATAVVAEIQAGGGSAIALQADLRNETEIVQLFSSVAQQLGRLDIAVNNAGIFEFLPLNEITYEHIEKHFTLNVFGLILCCREAVKTFHASGGSIINMSSCDSVYPPALGSVYSASKAAVDGITRSLSKELAAEGIRVNSINPGLVRTEGAEKGGFLTEEVISETISITPLGRIAEPAEIARVALFLASEDSSWITGEHLVVSGGQR